MNNKGNYFNRQKEIQSKACSAPGTGGPLAPWPTL